MRFEEDDEKTGKYHEYHKSNLDPSEEVLNFDSQFQETTMDYGDGSKQSNGQGFPCEFGAFNVEGKEGILGKDDAVACSKT